MKHNTIKSLKLIYGEGDKIFCKAGCGGGATRPLPRDEGVEELHGDPKMEEVVPKMARRRGSDTGQSRRR